ncbi:MAG TPA: hypothetical protein P5137_07175 [Candidatus Brocadiia bacterium]|nr:hypothetical protein [Candidatus Brocadiia bacterium]
MARCGDPRERTLRRGQGLPTNRARWRRNMGWNILSGINGSSSVSLFSRKVTHDCAKGTSFGVWHEFDVAAGVDE